MAWTSQTASLVGWAMPTPIVVEYPDVDFQLQFRTTYPMLLRSDRPLLMQSILSEGQP
jgi:hypothetical protein